MYELIDIELDQFVATKERAEHAILEQREYLQQRANEGKLSEGYARSMNYLLGSMATHMEATERLHQALGLALELTGYDPEERNRQKRRIGELQHENRKLRAWLKSLDKDLTLLPYMREKDFDFA